MIYLWNINWNVYIIILLEIWLRVESDWFTHKKSEKVIKKCAIKWKLGESDKAIKN